MDPDLLLVTCSAMPEGEPGHAALDTALAAAGVSARWVCWDDPGVDWGSALVAVRSTWDYDARRPEFTAWAASVPRLLNGAAVFAWNTDKAYLAELAAAGLPVVPTVVADAVGELPAAIALHAPAVVKPRVGAGGRGVVVVEGPDTFDPDLLGPGPWVVQPLVSSVRTEGETSVFVLGGEPVSMVRKLPAGEEIRVHEVYGGTTLAVVPTQEAGGLARRTVDVAERILGTPLHYARADLMRLADGTLAISELEVTEPGLYLEELPENGAAFAGLVRRLLDA
ncbi:MAG: RimK family alpha-L-glutamate ligase [Marmoricola sp.]